MPDPARNFPKGLAQMIASVPESVPADAVECLSQLGDMSRDDFYHCYRTLKTACGGDNQ
jgi:hypothetical protein